tara:strand:- start:314 stop:595 length:282 start_codon:yes stop_codon:yes gene_type:complete
MNLREAKKLKPGAIVRTSYTEESYQSKGIVLSKYYVKERHRARTLGGIKYERYEIKVHWYDNPPGDWCAKTRTYVKEKLQTHQNWELMVIQHA